MEGKATMLISNGWLGACGFPGKSITSAKAGRKDASRRRDVLLLMAGKRPDRSRHDHPRHVTDSSFPQGKQSQTAARAENSPRRALPGGDLFLEETFQASLTGSKQGPEERSITAKCRVMNHGLTMAVTGIHLDTSLNRRQRLGISGRRGVQSP